MVCDGQRYRGVGARGRPQGSSIRDLHHPSASVGSTRPPKRRFLLGSMYDKRAAPDVAEKLAGWRRGPLRDWGKSVCGVCSDRRRRRRPPAAPTTIDLTTARRGEAAADALSFAGSRAPPSNPRTSPPACRLLGMAALLAPPSTYQSLLKKKTSHSYSAGAAKRGVRSPLPLLRHFAIRFAHWWLRAGGNEPKKAKG